MKKVFNLAMSILFITLLTSCGASGGSGGNNDPTNPPNTAGALSIDNAGTVPILGSRATSTSIFIHNNSNTLLSGVSYTSTNTNLMAMTLIKDKISDYFYANDFISSGIAIDPASATNCNQIPAGGFCVLKFTTPSFVTNNGQVGSGVVTASYQVNGKIETFSQIINYQQIAPINDGVNLTSGVSISSFGHQTGYATIYVYSGNQPNKVNSLILDKPAFSISNNNLRTCL